MGKGSIPSIPDPWDFVITAGMTTKIDPASRIGMEVRGDQANPVTLKLEDVSLTTTLKGDPKAPVALQVELANLPRLTFPELLTLVKTVTTPNIRMALPIDVSVGISFFPFTVLGADFFTFRICGEPQIIVKEFIPNRFERCEFDCEPLEDESCG